MRTRSEKDRAQRTCSKDYVSLGAHLRHSGASFFLLSGPWASSPAQTRPRLVRESSRAVSKRANDASSPPHLVPFSTESLDRALPPTFFSTSVRSSVPKGSRIPRLSQYLTIKVARTEHPPGFGWRRQRRRRRARETIAEEI